MSKQYIVNRHTTPSTPALDEVPNEKIRVFSNETAIDAALSSLDENEIVATEDGAESSTRIGNPLGTILAIHSNAVPYGYLPCNGVAFDEHQYPALYALLGDNHTPYSYDKSRLGDYEDFALSTTNQEMPYDGVMIVQTKTNYTMPVQIVYVNDVAIGNLYFDYGGGGTAGSLSTIPFRKGDNIRISNTTNVTAKVAYYIHFNVIKATSGLEETQQDYVLQSLLEADNYSTDEVATGKKWIDGKMIYRRAFVSNVQLTYQTWLTIHSIYSNYDPTVVNEIISSNLRFKSTTTGALTVASVDVSRTSMWINSTAPSTSDTQSVLVLEYTKN
jgi:hypothetical protein